MHSFVFLINHCNHGIKYGINSTFDVNNKLPNFLGVGSQTPCLLLGSPPKPHNFTFLCVGYQPLYNKYVCIYATVHHCIERFTYNIASKNVYSSIEMHVSVVGPDVIASTPNYLYYRLKRRMLNIWETTSQVYQDRNLKILHCIQFSNRFSTDSENESAKQMASMTK